MQDTIQEKNESKQENPKNKKADASKRSLIDDFANLNSEMAYHFRADD